MSGPDEYPQLKPPSCCAHEPCPAPNNPYFHEGCADKLYSFLVHKSQLIAGIAIAVAAVEVSFLQF